MEEKLYTIPVNDAFDKDCECPICAMYNKLEEDAVAYTLGPSYMEDDIREKTDQLGFCEKHIDALYHQNNSLGLALILSTHFAKVNAKVEKLSKNAAPAKPKLFSKTAVGNPLTDYLDQVNGSCFVCSRINHTYSRYVKTVFYLYGHEPEFEKKYAKSKGFCMKHYAMLLKEAPSHLSGDKLVSFNKVTNELFLDNMKRVQGDLEWFVDKFDYRYINEPWKNSKDAIPRAITKTNSIVYEENAQK